MASPCPLISPSLMLEVNPYHDDHPIGGTIRPLSSPSTAVAATTTSNELAIAASGRVNFMVAGG